jgi:hypothetical protein
MHHLNRSLSLIAAMSLLSAQIAHALPIYGNTNTKASTNNTGTSQVLSADDFSSRVKAMGQQTKTELAKQASDALPKPINPVAGTQAPTPAAAATVTPPPASVPAPTPNQAYSGFGTGNKTTPETTKSPNNAPSTWNIKY